MHDRLLPRRGTAPVLRIAACALLTLALLACGDRESSDQAVDASSTPRTPSAGAVPSTTATLHFDLESGVLLIQHRETSRKLELGATHLGGRLAELRRRLAMAASASASTSENSMNIPGGERAPESAHTTGGPDLDRMAVELGRDMLVGTEWVAEVPHWLVTPPEAAPLSALVPPWGDGKEPLLTQVAVTYSTLERLQALAPFAGGHGGGLPSSAGTGVLALIPFTPGLRPEADDPDPLLNVIRSRVRRIDTVPRNLTTLPDVGGAIAEHHYGLIMLRSRPDQAQTLMPVIAGGPPLLWWVRPPLEMESTGALAGDRSLDATQAVLQRWLNTGRSVTLELWPRGEASVDEGAAAYIEALLGGAPADESLRRARLHLYRSGSMGMADWAGWVHAGEPDAPVGIDEPGWLQRLFR